MSGLRDVFTGGQCNADGTPMSQSSNPFKNFINQLVQDPGRQRQMMPGFMNIDPNQAQLNDVMAMMDQTWSESQRAEYEQRMRESAFMQQAFLESKMMEQEMMHKQALMTEHWNQEMEKETAAGWRADFLQNEVLDSREATMNAAFEKAGDQVLQEQAENLQATSGLISIMMNDPEPKFQNSKFLEFLKRVECGQYEITQDNQLLVHPEKAPAELAAGKTHLLNAAFDQAKAQEQKASQSMSSMNAAFAQASHEEEMSEKKLDSMEAAFQESTVQVERDIAKEREGRQKKLELLWSQMINNYNPDNPELMEKLNNEWLSMMNEWNEDMFSDHWQAATDIDEMQYLNHKKTYALAENKFSDCEAPHQMFLEFIKQGNATEAILALEAHLKSHPQDHLGWNMLGGLLQENDQDQKSISAFQQALKVKPDCLHTLLQLGVGCTNVLDEAHSAMYLQQWMGLHPKYKQFAGQQMLDESKLLLGEYAAEELIAINRVVLEKFEEARLHGGMEDPEFCMANGVVAFIAREYKLSVDLMNRVVELDPQSYSGWNKLGACLAQLSETEMGRMSYRKALDLKPNYVRPWVNLGMTYSGKRDYETAISYHLSALSLNPNLHHVWTYVESSLACKQEFENIPLLKQQNPRIFGSRFDVVSHADLPQPEGSDYITMLEKYSLKEKADVWAKSFDK